MTSQALDGHLGRSIELDVCAGCQAFWFDQHESIQLSPRATLQLFRVIGEQAAARRQALSAVAKCPRCHARLAPTHDKQRNVAFEYLRCPRGHGRFITFFDFLREKNFIRPLSAKQMEELRRNVQFVNCSNCGAPVDLGKGSACAHCGSPLSMLDMKRAETLVTTLQQADRSDRPIDPALPMRLEQARREVETAFAQFDKQPGWFHAVSSTDLVAASLGALAQWLKNRS